MDFKNTAKNLILGSADTAIITVRDCRAKAAELHIGDRESKAYLDLTAEQLKENENLKDFFPSSEFSEDRRYKVQFNPKELILSGQHSTVRKGNAEGADKSDNTVRDYPNIALTVALIFDEVNLFDCFTSEKFTPGVANMIKNATTAGMKLANKAWTVQPQAEAFIAALRNPYTRLIEFNWGEFSFEGNLEQLSVEYTMFSIEGLPVRANMRMRLVNNKSKHESKRWIEDFDAAFNAAFGDNQTSNYVSADGYVGNIFNAGGLGL